MHQPGAFTVGDMTRLTEELTTAWNLTANSTTAAAHFRRWRANHPELDDITTIAELAEAIRTGPRDQANTFVTILLHEAGRGDRCATETIVHALRYVALTVWRTYTPAGRRIGDDALCDVLTDIVEIVVDLAATGASAYPIRQIGNRLECRARRRRERDDDHRTHHVPWSALTPDIDTDSDEDRTDEFVPATVSLDAGTELLAVLVHAVAIGIISAPEASIVAGKAFFDRAPSGPVTNRHRRRPSQKRLLAIIGRLRTAANDITDSYLTAADLSTAA